MPQCFLLSFGFKVLSNSSPIEKEIGKSLQYSQFQKLRNNFNPLSTNRTTWSNTLQQFVRWQKPTNCLSVFDHFVGLKRLKLSIKTSFWCVYHEHISRQCSISTPTENVGKKNSNFLGG